MAKSGTNAGNSERESRVANQNAGLASSCSLADSRNTGNIFAQLVTQPLLHCKLKSVVTRIATFAPNLPRNKFRCCKLRQHVAQFVDPSSAFGNKLSVL